MATKKKEEEVADAPLKDAPAKSETPAHTSAVVYAHNGGHIRTYSLEVHGENFHDLAVQMAAQHQGSKIVLQ